MVHIRTALLAIITTSLMPLLSWGPPLAAPQKTIGTAAHPFASTVVVSFTTDPTRRPFGRFEVLGPGTDQFVYEAASRPRFLGDPQGSLAVTFDSLAPTSRYATRFEHPFTQDDDFILGSVLTIRPEGFAPDPNGFHPIAFSLFNATTTGNERTGNMMDFRANAYDTVEFSYFPNVSPSHRGPFVSPDVFGEEIDPDAFANFTFSSIPFELVPGITYLIECEHSAAFQTLTTRIWVIHPLGLALPVENGEVTIDLSGITGFLVDSLGISAYHDGFPEFSSSGRSLLATVDFDLLFSAPVIDGRIPPRLRSLLERLKRRHRVTDRSGLLR